MLAILPLHLGSKIIPGETYTVLLPYVPVYAPVYEEGQEVEVTDDYMTNLVGVNDVDYSIIATATIVKVKETHMSELGNSDLEREAHPHMRSWPNANEFLANQGIGSGLCSQITFTVHED
jgi:hypothetical protein